VGVTRQISNPASGFSEAVSVSGPGRTIHVSGSVGFGDDGKVVSGGMEAESRATFANIERVLRTAGAQMSDVVRITAFVTNLDAYADYAKVRSEVFGEHVPASATVQVAGLLVGAQIEIDAIAFVPEG
jgi:enamine deaminase RidA (YjgF/YER057c/UK114 family)